MNYYQLKSELLSPLMVQENRQSDSPRGLPYLPGSSLRGAVARHYLRTGGEPEDAAFKSLFLVDPVCFPDLLPVNDPEHIPRTLPATACSCKRSPGFRPQAGHGVGDALAALVAGEMEGRPLTEAFVCDLCGEDMKPLSGVWNAEAASPEKSEPVPVYHRHTGIDRSTGTVAATIFYITQGIAEFIKGSDQGFHPQHLSGGMFMTSPQAEMLAGMIGETVFAGADRTRGMGEMALTLVEAASPTFNLDAWDRRFREKLAALTQQPLPDGIFFSIGLEGHAILVDRYLRPTMDIDFDFNDIVPVRRVVDHQRVRGWQSSWRLPKPEDEAVGKGGVYLFRYEGSDSEGLKSYLSTLTMDGIGLRRTEGFGRVNVCDALHLQEVI